MGGGQVYAAGYLALVFRCRVVCGRRAAIAGWLAGWLVAGAAKSRIVVIWLCCRWARTTNHRLGATGPLCARARLAR